MDLYFGQDCMSCLQYYKSIESTVSWWFTLCFFLACSSFFVQRSAIRQISHFDWIPSLYILCQFSSCYQIILLLYQWLHFAYISCFLLNYSLFNLSCCVKDHGDSVHITYAPLISQCVCFQSASQPELSQSQLQPPQILSSIERCCNKNLL